MRHHVQRAKQIYKNRGTKELLKTTVNYLPIEINNIAFRARYGSGTKVMNEDWDTLILLDACRYDMFAEKIHFNGDLQSRISLGSTSEEFLAQNFANSTLHDTVYINTNPYLPRLGLDDRTFHAVVDLLNEWDSNLQTVHPETVVEAAHEVRSKFPNKRLIIHFMQPHVPFIGKKGQQISAKGWGSDQSEHKLRGKTIWQQLREGSFDDEESVWDAYNENLEIVLSYVELLLTGDFGKMIISSDHGNLVGERLWPIPTKKMYGHYYGVYTAELVKVPWFVIAEENRPQIHSDPPVDQRLISNNTVEKRLQSLGYK